MNYEFNRRYMIAIESIPAREDISPKRLFCDIAKYFGYSQVFDISGDDDRCPVYLYFPVYKDDSRYTKEKIIAINNSVKPVNIKSLIHHREMAVISYVVSKSGNESLNIRSYKTTVLPTMYDDEKKRKLIDFEALRDLNLYGSPEHVFVVYDSGKVWDHTKGRCTDYPRLYRQPHPCTMKELFYYQNDINVLREIFHALMLSWGRVYPIWRDLAADFYGKCSYSSIPLDTIFSCHNRKELMEVRYHHKLKRYNKISIGDSIVLERARRVVNEDEIQKLFGRHFPSYFIGRVKADMANPLAWYLIVQLEERFGKEALRVEAGETIIRIDLYYLRDTLRMAIRLGVKIPLSFNSVGAVIDFHDALAIRLRNKRMEKTMIPRNSKFENLKMPPDCKHLTTTEMLIEEGDYQHNCVATYVMEINHDNCSIWSMRKNGGERFTIEIRMDKTGKYIIAQMRGFANRDCPNEEYKRVADYIKASNLALENKRSAGI